MRKQNLERFSATKEGFALESAGRGFQKERAPMSADSCVPLLMEAFLTLFEANRNDRTNEVGPPFQWAPSRPALRGGSFALTGSTRSRERRRNARIARASVTGLFAKLFYRQKGGYGFLQRHCGSGQGSEFRCWHTLVCQNPFFAQFEHAACQFSCPAFQLNNIMVC